MQQGSDTWRPRITTFSKREELLLRLVITFITVEPSEYIKFIVITPQRHNNTIHFTPRIKTTPFSPKTAAPASIFHIRPAARVIIPLQCL